MRARCLFSFSKLQPAVAQFGIPGKKKGSSFQELNEQAKQMQAGEGGAAGGMGDLSKLMGDLDPKMLEEMAQLGSQFDEVMKLMAQMSPEELEKQMKDAMEMLQVDESGFDTMDRRLLMMIIENFHGGPVRVESIAAALSEERGTVEDVLEPYLIQQGYLTRTARGRMATARAYRHFGLNHPGETRSDLFE